MLKLKSENKFLEFLSSQKRSVTLALAVCAVCGVLLLGVGRGASAGTTQSTLEDETAELCSAVAGVGECRVMITYTEDERVYAVAVLCEGAESDAVRERLVSLASSLFGIGANRVSVLKLSK
ncbi:MAG: hypothetical protein IJW03_05360 [Clostridia bacterium]|nr:hypothetical protein [Clostridia bacterium]